MGAREIVHEFIEHINAQNVEELCALMSEHHRFVDALGDVIEGREQMRHAWVGYFRMVPDYRISCQEMIEQGDVVAAFGVAGGTYSPDGKLREENKWEVPAAWRADVNNGLVSEWRVYTDNEQIRRLMAKAGR